MHEKKKKGKKKKGSQSKHSGSIFIAEDVNQTIPDDSLSNAEVLPYNYHDVASVQNHHSWAPSNADIQSVGVSESDVDQENRKNLEAKCVELQQEINNLEVQKNIRSQKEGSLEERIKHLQNEVDSCIQKEASLEEKIDDLQSINDSLTMREGSLEEKIKLLQNDVDSWIQKESSIKEVVSRLGDANEGLQMQVMELKVSGDSLAQENKQLTDIMSVLESRIQHLEMVASFYASSKIQGEEKLYLKAAEAQIQGEEKLYLKAAEAPTMPDILNEDHSREEPEIHVEPVQLAGTAENPTNEKTINSSTMKYPTCTDHASEFHKSILESNENIETMAKANESFSVTGVEDIGSMEQSQQIQILGLDDDDSRLSEDVISVPLDDVIQELQTTTAEKIELEAEPVVVPLSDAPLIGAPFRLLSFVARFVSGADLVDQYKPKPDR